MPEKPRSGEVFIERQAQLRSSCSFRSATNCLSPINMGSLQSVGLSFSINIASLRDFPTDSLSEAANDMRVSEVFSYIPALDLTDRWRLALDSMCQGASVFHVVLFTASTAILPWHTPEL